MAGTAAVALALGLLAGAWWGRAPVVEVAAGGAPFSLTCGGVRIESAGAAAWLRAGADHCTMAATDASGQRREGRIRPARPGRVSCRPLGDVLECTGS